MLGSIRSATSLGQQIGVNPRRRCAVNTVDHRPARGRDEVRKVADLDAMATAGPPAGVDAFMSVDAICTA